MQIYWSPIMCLLCRFTAPTQLLPFARFYITFNVDREKKSFPSLKSVLRFSNCISLIRNSKENVKECTQGLWELFRVKLSTFSFLCFLLRRISWSRYCTGLRFGCWSWNVATISENLTSIGLLIITNVQNSMAQYVGTVWAYTRSPEVVASSP